MDIFFWRARPLVNVAAAHLGRGATLHRPPVFACPALRIPASCSRSMFTCIMDGLSSCGSAVRFSVTACAPKLEEGGMTQCR